MKPGEPEAHAACGRLDVLRRARRWRPRQVVSVSGRIKDRVTGDVVLRDRADAARNHLGNRARRRHKNQGDESWRPTSETFQPTRPLIVMQFHRSSSTTNPTGSRPLVTGP